MYGFSLGVTFCFVAETCVELESVLNMNIVVRVPAGKVFRMSIGSGLGGHKFPDLAGRADFWVGLGGHKANSISGQ